MREVMKEKKRKERKRKEKEGKERKAWPLVNCDHGAA